MLSNNTFSMNVLSEDHPPCRRPTLLKGVFISIITIALYVVATKAVQSQTVSRCKDAKASIEQRIDDLMSRLTQDEKLTLLTGTGFGTPAIERLGIPAMPFADAGQGVRGGLGDTLGPATAFPCGVAMASSWDVDLLSRIGHAIGQEARNKGSGTYVLLGPAVNIQRSPLGGRNGEYFSEDPYLSARLAVAYIQGMQGMGVGACIKHFLCNNEEIDRDYVDVKVDERTLREIYLPAFEAGVKEAGVWTVMSAYNKVNGPYCSANTYLLTDVLKKGWGFDGLVMSDWGGVHETPVAQAGNDLEMPGGEFATLEQLKEAIEKRTLTQDAVDDSVRRILRTIIRVGLMDNPLPSDPSVINCKAHQELALETAQKGTVLLKNENGMLPFNRNEIKSIAVIGDVATALQIGALGSPAVTPFYTIQMLEGIREKAGKGIEVTYVEGVADRPVHAVDGGFQASYYSGTRFKGEPFLERVDSVIQFDRHQLPGPEVPDEDYSVRWRGQVEAPVSGVYTFYFTGDDGYRVKLDGRKLIERWNHGSAERRNADVTLEAGKHYEVEIEFFQGVGEAVAKFDWATPITKRYEDAIEVAKAADVVVVCVGTDGSEGEGHDRLTMDLPLHQDQLIRSVAAANPNTVVVLNTGTPVSMSYWLADISALIQTWFPGQEGGAALADILFGDVNPSGKLPTTFATARMDYPDFGNFPGRKGVVKYEEGIYVGYRHFDKYGIAPTFPFGHGLSYTTFSYTNMTLSAPALSSNGTVQVSVDISNTGNRAGEEVVQLYVRDPDPRIDKPIRELKGFAKVGLDPKQTKTVTLTLAPPDLAYFDVEGKQWKADAGSYSIDLGASSRDIRQTAVLNLAEAFTEAVPLSRQF